MFEFYEEQVLWLTVTALSDGQPWRLREEGEVCFVFIRRGQSCHGGWSKSDVKCERFDWEQREFCLLEMSQHSSHLCRLSARQRWWGWTEMRNEAETHLLDSPPPAPRVREQRFTVCDTQLCSQCENTKRYLGFSAQFYSIRAIFMSSYYLPHPVGGGNGWKCQNYESEGCNIKLTFSTDTSEPWELNKQKT